MGGDTKSKATARTVYDRSTGMPIPKGKVIERKFKFGKIKTSGAVATNPAAIDTRGLSFKKLPTSNKAVLNNVKKIQQALDSGKTLTLRNTTTGSIQQYKRNRDGTVNYSNGKMVATVSREDGYQSFGSWFVVGKKTKQSEYAIS